jgi:hypothetical protein
MINHQVIFKNADDIYQVTRSMNQPKKQLDTNHLPSKQRSLKLEMELPFRGLETCLACEIMENLCIKCFNSIPGNCHAKLQEDFWCSQLHLNKMLNRLNEI